MPVPVSTTSSLAEPSTTLSRTVMPPVKVNFSAFDSRFSTILPHRSRSTSTGWPSGGTSITKARPALVAEVSNMLASSRVNCARSTGSKTAWARPDSSREKSSSVLTSLSSR